MSERVEREKSFHNNRFGGADEERSAASKYYAAAESARAHFFDLIERHARGRDLLEVGCGTGAQAQRWNHFGARVTGIDISEQGIERAKESSMKENTSIEYRVMNAEEMEFSDNSFDTVVGGGILHHLELEKAYAQVARVLRKDGHMIFLEPLGHNPIINLYRLLTPRMRSEDEHPLLRQDLRKLYDYFQHVDLRYFVLFSLAAVPFRSSRIFPQVLATLAKIDEMLFKISFVQRFAWMVVIHCSAPFKSR